MINFGCQFFQTFLPFEWCIPAFDHAITALPALRFLINLFSYRRGDDDGAKRDFYAIKVLKKSEAVQKNMVSQVIAERNALALTRYYKHFDFCFENHVEQEAMENFVFPDENKTKLIKM